MYAGLDLGAGEVGDGEELGDLAGEGEREAFGEEDGMAAGEDEGVAFVGGVDLLVRAWGGEFVAGAAMDGGVLVMEAEGVEGGEGAGGLAGAPMGLVDQGDGGGG